MGLAISVGLLADLLENDLEGAEWVREELEKINSALRKHGLPEHTEPETLPTSPYRGQILSFPYSYLHRLRRALAYARQAPEEFAQIDRTREPDEDPLIDDELSVYMDSHIICHSDCEGYYVPIDFADVIYGETDDDIPGGMLGSSYRVLDELVQTAPVLDIRLTDGRLSDDEARSLAGEQDGHPYEIERIVWFSFYEAARLSIEYKVVIAFG
jgi:hypothetical protein